MSNSCHEDNNYLDYMLIVREDGMQVGFVRLSNVSCLSDFKIKKTTMNNLKCHKHSLSSIQYNSNCIGYAVYYDNNLFYFNLWLNFVMFFLIKYRQLSYLVFW